MGKRLVSRSTVYATCKLMNPKVAAIKLRQQGGTDPTSNWCIASYRWSTQLLLRLGKMEQHEVPVELKNADGTWPDCFNKSKLSPIDIRCVQWWDETHKKQRVGRVRGNTRLQYQFPRFANGGVAPNGGSLPPRKTELKMKYEKEARFMTGMCLKLKADGNIATETDPADASKERYLGTCLPIFEYLEQNIVSSKGYHTVRDKKIDEPKSASDKSRWVEKTRVKGLKYMGDPVSTLPGLKSPKLKPVMEEWGIETVADFVREFTFEGIDRLDFAGNTRKSNYNINFVNHCRTKVKTYSQNKQNAALAAAEKAEEGTPRDIPTQIFRLFWDWITTCPADKLHF